MIGAVPQEDVELIRSLMPSPETDLAALLRDDGLWSQLAGGLAQTVDPDVESVAVWQGGTAHTGIDGFRRMWLDWLEPWATYHSSVEELIDADGCVVALAHDRGRRADLASEVEISAGSTWELRDGRIVRVVFYGNYEDALAAAGVDGR
jgi:hypothetical protein